MTAKTHMGNPVLSVSHANDCGVFLGHYSRASWNRCTCIAKTPRTSTGK